MDPKDQREAIGVLEKRVELLRKQDDELAGVLIHALEDVIAELDASRPSRRDLSGAD
jgi:hypothetical protein